MKIDTRTQAAISAGHPEWAELPATRKEACEVGVDVYFTGKACKHGHVDFRWTAWGCAACRRAYYAAYSRERRQDPEFKSRQRAYERERNKDPEFKSRQRAYDRERRQDPQFVAKENAHGAKRRSIKKRSLWPHMTDAMRDQIKMVYTWSKRLTEWTGVTWHVDHIIPLQHPDVQGYHVLHNLQILTASENCSKSNTFDYTHDNEGWRETTPPNLSREKGWGDPKAAPAVIVRASTARATAGAA